MTCSHYFIFNNDDIEKKKKKSIKEENNRHHISPSIKNRIEKNTLILNDKIIASSVPNNSRELEKDSNEISESLISLSTLEAFNNVDSTFKTTSK